MTPEARVRGLLQNPQWWGVNIDGQRQLMIQMVEEAEAEVRGQYEGPTKGAGAARRKKRREA